MKIRNNDVTWIANQVNNAAVSWVEGKVGFYNARGFYRIFEAAAVDIRNGFHAGKVAREAAVLKKLSGAN